MRRPGHRHPQRLPGVREGWAGHPGPRHHPDGRQQNRRRQMVHRRRLHPPVQRGPDVLSRELRVIGTNCKTSPGTCQSVKKPRRVCRPQAANQLRSFAGACTWQKILLSLQVWNLFAFSEQIMRAADCKPFVQKGFAFFGQSQPSAKSFRRGVEAYYRLFSRAWTQSASGNKSGTPHS